MMENQQRRGAQPQPYPAEPYGQEYGEEYQYQYPYGEQEQPYPEEYGYEQYGEEAGYEQVEEPYYYQPPTGETTYKEYGKSIGVGLEEYEEDLLTEEEFLTQEKIYIKSMQLLSVADVQKVVNELRKGNIVILNIETLASKDAIELKRAIEQLKGITSGIGGDIAAITDERVIVTPSFVQVWKKR